MSDIIKMDYALMEEMGQTFLQAVEQLQDTMQEMQSIANTLEGGALLGQGGAAFTDALRGKLSPAISRLIDKCQELSGDVQGAMQDMKEADEASRNEFGN
jgi:WXG100 family type VII secretion target